MTRLGRRGWCFQSTSSTPSTVSFQVCDRYIHSLGVVCGVWNFAALSLFVSRKGTEKDRKKQGMTHTHALLLYLKLYVLYCTYMFINHRIIIMKYSDIHREWKSGIPYYGSCKQYHHYYYYGSGGVLVQCDDNNNNNIIILFFYYYFFFIKIGFFIFIIII